MICGGIYVGQVLKNGSQFIPILLCIQEVHQLEILCKKLYESTNATERADAEKALVGFQVTYISAIH